MHPRLQRVSRALGALGGVAVLAGSVATTSAASPTRVLVPIGSDYQAPTMERFARAAAAQDRSGRIVLLVLPITYSADAFKSSAAERKENLGLAAGRARTLQDACNTVKSAKQRCVTRVVPVLTRPDAYKASNVGYITPDVDGMYILGGDQGVAMQVVADTPFEKAIAAAYARGAVVGGNSAGAAVQSRTMMNGYTGDNGPEQSLQKGTVDLWTYSGPGDRTRGLVFGLLNAVMEQHIYERGRFGRALNVAVTTGLPVLGMDAATGGAVVDGRRLTDVVGFTSGAIIDPVTWNPTGRFAFAGPDSTLSVRGVAAHLVPPGGYGYDLGTLRPTVDGVGQPAPSVAGRTYPTLTTPASAGALLLSGGLVGGPPTGIVLSRLVAEAGGKGARIVVLAAGYAKSDTAAKDAQALADAIGPSVAGTVDTVVLDADTDAATTKALVAEATGIVLTAPDRSTVLAALEAQQGIVDVIRSRWWAGATLLADNAAAAAIGARMVTDPPPGDDIDAESSEDFLASGATVATGLGWLGGATIEPRLLPDRNWGQLWHLVAALPGSLAVGVDVGTALDVRAGVATVRGASAAVVLDGRTATFGVGSNGAIAARWVALDTFVDGETLAP